MRLKAYPKSPAPSYYQTGVEEKSLVVVPLRCDQSGNKFAGDTSPISIWESGYAGTFTYTQEVAVVVDGVWYKFSKAENFKFDMKASM